MEIVVVGHFSRDLIITPEFTREALGGGVAYAMLAPALGALGAGIVSRVGQDFEQEYIDVLRASGLDLTGLRTSGPHTTRCVNKYNKNGKRTQRLEAIAPSLRGEDLLPQHLQAAIVHFCPLSAGELHVSVIEAAKMSGALVSLDVQGYLRESRIGPVKTRRWEERDEVLRFVDVVKADDVEIMKCSNAKTELAAVTEILELGPRIVAVTRDCRGSTIYSRNTQVDIPAVLPAKLVDSTGAGDTYIIGFMLEFVRCGDVKRAGLFGATCASFNLETVGPYGMPDRSQVESRMKAYS